jgi:hypothetical protein
MENWTAEPLTRSEGEKEHRLVASCNHVEGRSTEFGKHGPPMGAGVKQILLTIPLPCHTVRKPSCCCWHQSTIWGQHALSACPASGGREQIAAGCLPCAVPRRDSGTIDRPTAKLSRFRLYWSRLLDTLLCDLLVVLSSSVRVRCRLCLLWVALFLLLLHWMIDASFFLFFFFFLPVASAVQVRPSVPKDSFTLRSTPIVVRTRQSIRPWLMNCCRNSQQQRQQQQILLTQASWGMLVET